VQFALKVLVTSVIVVGVSELGRRSPFWGAVLASLPLTSLLAFLWLWRDTGDTEQIAALSTSIFWLVLPSLVLFLVLPAMLRAGWSFGPSLAGACAATVVAYTVLVRVLGSAGVAL
jgi:hypothetical protein